MRGAPGDFLSIGISGYDNFPPVVAIETPKDRDTFTAGPISVTGKVDDPKALLMINGIPVTVEENGSFVLDGVVITEGENVIEAVATDTCGNEVAASERAT